MAPIFKELLNIANKIDQQKPLGKADSNAIREAARIISRSVKTNHPAPKVKQVLDLFPNQIVCTCGPEDDGIYELTGISQTTMKLGGKYVNLAEFNFYWDESL